MPTKTGIWVQGEANEHHAFSYRLAQFIGSYFPKDKQVIDIGCGTGAYLRYLEDVGFKSVIGVEGYRLNNFETKSIIIHDLSTPFVAPNKGNVVCLEVGEHIPKEYEDIVMGNICRSCMDAGKIVMSWALPYQEGIGHVNCRGNKHIIDKIERNGFVFLKHETEQARGVIEGHCAYFRHTIMIFEKL